MSTRTDVRALRTRNEERCLRLLARSELLDTSGLDWSQAGAVELDAGVVDTLVYMRDVEGFTDSYVVGIGAHRTTLGDPIISAFLEAWQAEEAEHSAAIGRFLEHYAEQRGVTIAGRCQPPQPGGAAPRTGPDAHRRPRRTARRGGPHDVGGGQRAAHHERLPDARGSGRATRCSPTSCAASPPRRSRTTASTCSRRSGGWPTAGLARTVIPRIMDGSWTPVGVGDGYKTSEEFQRVLAVLNAQPESERIIDRMDRRFARLPGLERLRIYRTAATPATT